MQQFDISVLRKPITLQEARQQIRSYTLPWKVGLVTLEIVTAIPLLLLIGLSAGGVISLGGAFFLAVIAAGGLYGLRDLYGEINENVLVRRLALHNDMAVHFDYKPDEYPGFMFAGDCRIPRSIRTKAELFVELGQWRPFLNRRSQNSVTRSYIRIKLPYALPRIILKRRKGSLVDAVPDGVQLRLEGKFGDLFNLYAPAGSEADALYIFTPDVMERFMDATSDFDVEIIGDELYFYSATKLDLAQPATLVQMATIINHVLAKFSRQSDKFARSQASMLQVTDPATFRLKASVFSQVIAWVFVGLLVIVAVLQIVK